MSFLRDLFEAPRFKDEVKAHRAYLLHVILLTFIFLPVPYLIYLLLQNPEEATRDFTLIAISEVINVILYFLLRQGHIQLSSILHVLVIWSLFAFETFTGSSVYGLTFMLGNGLSITLAGILLGGRAAAAMTLLAIIQGGGLVFAELQGWTPPDKLDDGLYTYAVSIMLLTFVMSLQRLATRNTEEALARANASEERYRLISQVSSDYTFSTALDSAGNMHLNWVAGAFEEITGYTIEEYVANGGWPAHIHPDDVEQDAQDMATIRQNQKVVTELRTLTKDRKVCWVRVYGHPVWDETKNKLTGIVGAVQDITEHKRIADREASHQASLEKVLELGKHVTESTDLQTTYKRIWNTVRHDLNFDRLGIYMYDAENRSMNATFGTSIHGEMVDETGENIRLDDLTIETKSFSTALKDHNGLYFTNQYDVIHNIQKGHTMYGVKDYAAVAAWSGNKPVAVLCVDNAISKQPITSQQLESLRLFAGYAGLALENSRLNEALQTELAQRQTFINELETKNAELERFTYTASHDLKSPLVTITGFLGYLEQDALAGNTERIKSGIDRITAAATKMQALLNDLLELSRVGRIMNKPEDVPFEEIVNEAIDHVHGQSEKLDALVVSQTDYPVIHGDRVRLVEVVQNLIENALKYSRPNIQPHIEIGTNGKDINGYPILYVRDNGIGIEEQFHENIFGLFNKLDAQSEGTGIGLSLVKRIIEVHDGRIWVRSEKGKGAAFYFTLPITQAKE